MNSEMLNSCVIIDTETTGIDHSVDKLVELAGVMFHSEDFFTSLCNPGRDIPPGAKAVHHITEDMVEYQPTPATAMLEMLISLKYPQLAVAHNAKFDSPFLYELAPNWQPIWICTYKCALMTWPDAPGHSNQVLRYHLGLKPEIPSHLAPHRALYDILVTREIFRELLKINSLEQLITWSSGPIVLKKVMFGKHKGKIWEEVDYGYLKWCINAPNMNEDVVHTAQHWISQRYSR